MDKYIGMKLDGRYEITDLIGIGGMADVYKAVDIMEGRVVAVKILKNEYAKSEEFVRRFRNESKAIAVLSHPNIVQIYDVGFSDDMQFIVMEYIDGITLKEYIEQQGVLKWKDAVHFTVQILRALQLAHDRGIIHRDIKPQNIMLLSDGTIKVMDFGIARFARKDMKTLSEKTIGSVHYISPEQARGDITDEKSDIYSVGVMLYEMLTGVKPFDADTPVAVALMHMQDVAKYPRDIVDSIPSGLEEIVIKAMEKDPFKRYQSAAEMIKDIEAFKRDQSIVFGYKDGVAPKKPDDKSGSTIYFNPVGNDEPKQKLKPQRKKPAKYVDDDDDDDEPNRSYIIPILSAVAVVVIIVGALFCAKVVMDAFSGIENTSTDFSMPNLVGMNYDDAKAQYTDILLEPQEEFNSEYPAGQIIRQEKAEGRIVKIGDTIRVWVSKGTKTVSVPDIVNFHYKSAADAIDAEGLVPVRIDKESDDVAVGYVISTEPAAYEQAEVGSQVKIYVSLGSMDTDTVVPNVIGRTQEEATAMLESAYLSVTAEKVDVSEPAGTVVSQSLEADTEVTKHSECIIYVSTGTARTYKSVLKLAIPSGVSGGYTFNVYGEDGSALMEPITIHNCEEIAYSFYNVEIEGMGIQTVTVEVTSLETMRSNVLAKYTVDFAKNTSNRIEYDKYAFRDAAR